MDSTAPPTQFSLPGGLAPCIPPLLDALGWRGSDTNLAEAMPHLSESLDLSDLLNVLANLKYSSRSTKLRFEELDRRMLPCLFIDDNGVAMVLSKGDGETLLAFSSDTKAYGVVTPDSREGAVFFFSQVDTRGHSLHKTQKKWFSKVIRRFSKPLKQGLLISFFLSLLALALPLFIMSIYDQLPFFNDNITLAYIVVGVLVFILSDFGLRIIRSGILSFVGARLGNIVGNEVFRRILFMPPAYTESASIGSQASRIRDFDTVRDFFSGQAFVALLEIPFITILLVAMWILGGYVVFVPLVAIGIFFILAAIYYPLVTRANEQSAKAGAERQELVMEILTKMRAIKLTSTPLVWESRFRQISADCAINAYRSSQLASQINVMTNALIMGAGVSTMAVSVYGVIQKSMTMGSLIACIILVWRVLAPLRSGFLVMLQVERISKSIGQVDRLMDLKIEQHTESMLTLDRKLHGDLAFSQVSIRYMSDAHPALLGVTFEVNRGEFVAIAGHDGAGKSTLLKLIIGLYRPQAGRITIDKTSLRQMDPINLRRSIGYVPQMPQFFYGTIAQNLRLTNPLAPAEVLEKACARADVLDDVLALRDGFDTRIGDYKMKMMPISFLKKLNLARTLMRSTSLLLLDEVLERPSAEGKANFLQLVDDLRNESTVMAVTNNVAYLERADKVLWLEKGRVRQFGTPDEVLPNLPEEYQC